MDIFSALGLEGKNVGEGEGSANIAIYYTQSVDAPGPTPEPLAALKAFVEQRTQTLTQGYFWQREAPRFYSSFNHPPPWTRQRRHNPSFLTFDLPKRTKEDEPPSIWSILKYGDNIEDEWLMVAVLFQLSKAIHNIAIRIWDDDGQFLLIEAAHVLPRWVKPELMDHRVWIRNGSIHLIPLPSSRQKSCFSTHIPLASPSVADALGILALHDDGNEDENTANVVPTKSEKITMEIVRRVDRFQSDLLNPSHRRFAKYVTRTAVALHPLVSLCLLQDPQLIAPAVHAFYYRDVDDMKAVSKMRFFAPVVRLVSLVEEEQEREHPASPHAGLTNDAVVTPSKPFLLTHVNLSRCHLAMLTQQRFSPPKGFGSVVSEKDGVTAAAIDLGIKIWAGFEILSSRSRRDPKHFFKGILKVEGGDITVHNASNANSAISDDGNGGNKVDKSCSSRAFVSQEDPKWIFFKKNLDKWDFFEGEMSGSNR
mmetsp:Transcript_31931/g.58073  ORF Transcript_31931/g.58073 Transcript_31931/m.58073 type:complete len:480 (-) Transcript_31931:82-1521(-)